MAGQERRRSAAGGRVINFYSEPGMFWVRVFGWGLHLKDLRKHGLMFSERMGLRGRKIGRYYLTFLERSSWR